MNKIMAARSLSTKISVSIAVISLTVLVILFALLEKINREAFYNIELEKATIIADTIEPLIAMDMYLGLDQKIDQIAHQLIENPNILAVELTKEGKVIYELSSKSFTDSSGDWFRVSKAVMQPNAQRKIADLELIYSSKHYKELTNQYTTVTVYLLLGLAVIFILFSFYVRKLLFPLKIIARSLREYRPESELEVPYSEHENEIGRIAQALNKMQSRISKYAKVQKDINQVLEEEVSKKTAQLRRQLYTDALTGLPNRIKLIENIETVGYKALLLINIDDFKEVNDLFGHLAGDTILVEFAEHLQKFLTLQPHIKLYKLSGDEFALLFTEANSEEDIRQFIQRLLAAIEIMSFYHENNEIGLLVTIGATLNMDSALEKADIALKSARVHHEHFIIYDEKLNVEEQYKANMEWVQKLKYAIDNDGIIPFFQPIFDNSLHEIAGYECLMRMVDSNGKYISPFFFLEIAKKSRLYTQLTKIIVEKSCRHFQHLDCRFSINLSVEDMLNSETVAFIKEQVATYDVADKIIFEILESEGIENYDDIARFINEMKQIGCKVAIDDFGSGYSNFEHLLQLKVDFIKIDGTLIKNVHADDDARIVVETIVDFARKLNIKTVAEFVHSDEVYEKVKLLKIDRSQGFFLGEPGANTHE